MKITNITTGNWENAIRGMRNPKESHHLSDSSFGFDFIKNIDTNKQLIIRQDYKSNIAEWISLGEKDLKLAIQLIQGGTEHRKFLRQIFISMDITAPLLWFKEFDTYKIGTTANSTSTMHTILKAPITLSCFTTTEKTNTTFLVNTIIPYLEELRQKAKIALEKSRNSFDLKESEDYYDQYLEAWDELVRLLPESWNQTRTWTANYENCLNILKQRRNHKLKLEWQDIFCNTVLQLPYMKKFDLK